MILAFIMLMIMIIFFVKSICRTTQSQINEPFVIASDWSTQRIDQHFVTQTRVFPEYKNLIFSCSRNSGLSIYRMGDRENNNKLILVATTNAIGIEGLSLNKNDGTLIVAKLGIANQMTEGNTEELGAKPGFYVFNDATLQLELRWYNERPVQEIEQRLRDYFPSDIRYDHFIDIQPYTNGILHCEFFYHTDGTEYIVASSGFATGQGSSSWIVVEWNKGMFQDVYFEGFWWDVIFVSDDRNPDGTYVNGQPWYKIANGNSEKSVWHSEVYITTSEIYTPQPDKISVRKTQIAGPEGVILIPGLDRVMGGGIGLLQGTNMIKSGLSGVWEKRMVTIDLTVVMDEQRAAPPSYLHDIGGQLVPGNREDFVQPFDWPWYREQQGITFVAGWGCWRGGVLALNSEGEIIATSPRIKAHRYLNRAVPFGNYLFCPLEQHIGGIAVFDISRITNRSATPDGIDVIPHHTTIKIAESIPGYRIAGSDKTTYCMTISEYGVIYLFCANDNTVYITTVDKVLTGEPAEAERDEECDARGGEEGCESSCCAITPGDLSRPSPRCSVAGSRASYPSTTRLGGE